MLEKTTHAISLNTTEELIADISQGKMVILLDDEDRENEGDLVMAAQFVTPDAINFMARYGRGLICLPMPRERCERLQLPLMVKSNNTQYRTNFTVSIEAATGVTTGISCADRAITIKTASALHAKASDIVQPGHVFPLMAQVGSVLTRAGHTEAVCDLVKLANAGDCGVLVEILNEDGTMARRPQLEAFAKEHGIKMGTIADLIHYRLANEQTVKLERETDISTQYGDFRLLAFRDLLDNNLHLCVVKGDIAKADMATVRVHIHDVLTDSLGILPRQQGRWTLPLALQELARQAAGVLLLLGKPYDPDELLAQIDDYHHQRQGEVVEPSSAGHYRVIGAGCQILKKIGVSNMRLLTTGKRFYALSGFNLTIKETVAAQ